MTDPQPTSGTTYLAQNPQVSISGCKFDLKFETSFHTEIGSAKF